MSNRLINVDSSHHNFQSSVCCLRIASLVSKTQRLIIKIKGNQQILLFMKL